MRRHGANEATLLCMIDRMIRSRFAFSEPRPFIGATPRHDQEKMPHPGHGQRAAAPHYLFWKARRRMKPIAETTNGRIRGMSGDNVLTFRGIRYAASTGGSNRFRPPQSVEKWAGVIDVEIFGASAPQLAKPESDDPFYSWYSGIRQISEDCLFLNVFTPGIKGKRPVMLWIHGGGWRDFSGTAPGFDGSRLAASQDVVVVTINHRLNIFGFLKLDGEDDRFADSGNAGTLDMVAALEWVRDNIEAFGGDPGNVTIFGESGGASKVAALMAVESAKGLFHKAIVQSSAGVRLATFDEATRASRSLATILGKPRLDPAEMQALPMDVLLDAMRQAGFAYRGMIDGRTFAGEPFATSAPAASSDIPLLIGCTSSEFTYYIRNDDRNFHLDMEELRQRLHRFFDLDDARVDTLLNAYRQAEPELDASGLLIAIATDQIFKRSTYSIASHQACSRRALVYAYHFEWETPIEGGRMRSPHTCEVPFIFGTVDSAAGCLGTAPDLHRLSDRMMSIWSAFARSGNPNTERMPDWQSYDPDGRAMMALDLECRPVCDPKGQRRAALDALAPFGSRNHIPVLANMAPTK